MTPLKTRAPFALLIALVALILGACTTEEEPSNGADATSDANGGSDAQPDTGLGSDAAPNCTGDPEEICCDGDTLRPQRCDQETWTCYGVGDESPTGQCPPPASCTDEADFVCCDLDAISQPSCNSDTGAWECGPNEMASQTGEDPWCYLPETQTCGNRTCDIASQFCAVDEGDPGGPSYICAVAPDECAGTPACGCIMDTTFPDCSCADSGGPCAIICEDDDEGRPVLTCTPN